MLNIEQLYIDNNIEYVTEGHKHTSPGWTHTACPFCSGHKGYHLGYNNNENYFNCWRCGYHSITDTISTLLNVPISKAKEIIKIYSEDFILKEKPKLVEIQPFKLPSNSDKILLETHKKYLRSRNFDYEKLQKIWDIRGTGVFSKLGNIDYKHRLIVPIYWNNQIATFVTRDITEKHSKKYLTCPAKYEIINIKSILYGNQNFWNDSIIVVEGVFDCWRLGVNSVAVFGIKFSNYQIRLLSKFKRVFIIFDNEIQAIQQAKKLVSELKFRGTKAEIIKIKDDPAALSQQDADYLVKNLIK